VCRSSQALNMKLTLVLIKYGGPPWGDRVCRAFDVQQTLQRSPLADNQTVLSYTPGLLYS
jgi:hypothetical protein